MKKGKGIRPVKANVRRRAEAIVHETNPEPEARFRQCLDAGR